MVLISFPLIASDCDKVLSGNEPVPEKFIGEWRLVQQTGALQDICPQENISFRSDGIAELTCPDGQTILRDYSITSTELRYDETSLLYEYEFDNNDQNLNLYGVNVSRNLFYEKIIAANNNKDKRSESEMLNSSEVIK